MMRLYESEKYPNQDKRDELARRIGMSSRKIQNWFHNKREKDKKTIREARRNHGAVGALASSSAVS